MKLKRWLKTRSREGSTWAGLASAVAGAGLVAGWGDAGQVAGAVAAAGEQVVGGNLWGGLIALGLSVAAIVTQDKDEKD